MYVKEIYRRGRVATRLLREHKPSFCSHLGAHAAVSHLRFAFGRLQYNPYLIFSGTEHMDTKGSKHGQ